MRSHIANRRLPRQGFTLIELLVVIAIIMVLMGLILAAYGAVVSASRKTATQATIEKVQKLLDQRRDAFAIYFSNPKNLENMSEYQEAVREAGGDAALATLLAKKKLLRRWFPQNFSELDLHSSMTAAGNHKAETESAELLYFILTNTGSVLGAPTVGQDELSGLAVDDIDKDGLKEILDGWGRPLRFYRWPTRLIKNDGINVSTTFWNKLNKAQLTSDQLKVDQDDPLGKTSAGAWGGSATFEADYHTPSTYHVMLLISAGLDGNLGLYEPSDTTNNGRLAAPIMATAGDDLNDNLSNLNIVAGGK